MATLRNTPSSILSRTSSRQLSQQSSRSNIFGRISSKRSVLFDAEGAVTVEKTVPKKSNVKVYDEFGVDVTPKSLLASYSNGSNESKTILNESLSGAAPGDMFNQSIFSASVVRSNFAAGFSKSILSSMVGGSSQISLDSVADDINYANTSNFNGLQDFHTKNDDSIQEEEKEILSDSDIKKMVAITLEETETIWHLDIPGVAVPLEESVNLKNRIELYDQLCKNRVGNDMYVERGMQTYNDAYKTKETQTFSILFKEQSCQVTGWEIYDLYKELASPLNEDNDDDDIFGSSLKTQNATEPQNNITDAGVLVSQIIKSASISSESTATLDSCIVSQVENQESFASEKTAMTSKQIDDEMITLIKNGHIKESLFFMERVILQNIFQDKQAAFRGLRDFKLTPPIQNECLLETRSSSTVPNLMVLWSYNCSITKEMSVNCMVWNKRNKDLLAVGYGSKDFRKGNICIWSVKNLEFPERVYNLNSAVTSIDFSSLSPNFLAVGLYNGAISVYNIRSEEDRVVVDSRDSAGKHGAPVWQLKWILKDRGTTEDKGEVLVSSSADGRVSQWSIRKGLEYIDLMRLKRTHAIEQSSKKKNEKKSDALISRLAAGMCFDFHPSEGNTYLVGTEEGLIHRCSCSYNEQFLETYKDHKGTLYSLQWSPFDEDVFMSCSSDWTIRLWTLEKTESILTLQSSSKAVIEIDWSPMSHSLLCAISEHQIEIWNLCSSTLDPILSVKPEVRGKLTSVKFALNSEALLVGDSEGRVTVYLMRNIPASPTNIRLKNLLNNIQKNAEEEEGVVETEEMINKNTDS
ncbi:dynein axonemal intermediate chain 4-like [Hydra vulgaris]|uniref:Dynein axonemal intermediate chain 4 n=1 Tax=Hydra vulgaris TaxID=6087 RepID=A0ABM4DFJ0_HYDVU